MSVSTEKLWTVHCSRMTKRGHVTYLESQLVCTECIPQYIQNNNHLVDSFYFYRQNDSVWEKQHGKN